MERWLPVVGFEGLYEVSDFGRVRSLERTVPDRRQGSKRIRERLLKLSKDHYPKVVLSKFNERHEWNVHQLVLETFIEIRPDGMEARHLNGNSKDASLTNLIYGTKVQNQGDRVQHGTHDRGERSVNAKLKVSDVIKIRNPDWRLNIQETADLLGVSHTAVWAVKNRRTWKWL